MQSLSAKVHYIHTHNKYYNINNSQEWQEPDKPNWLHSAKLQSEREESVRDFINNIACVNLFTNVSTRIISAFEQNAKVKCLIQILQDQSS